ncbi:hypothetical protein [Polluticoccus soli]|uniref:hypothetical protein n=1 Tax=Polluticoccus soli TaxID=3034150 RepID=UPI0023E33C59|nr:hypothetical protein [Flavipsychrobacter sp. JY13-12]
MRFPLVILLVLLSLHGYSQNLDNYIQVISNTSLNFSLNTVAKIEADQTISNALTLQLSSKDKNREVYARVSSVTSPSGFTLTSPYPVKLLFVSHNSSNVSNLVSTALQLTNTDQRLFSQKKLNSDVQFIYSLIFAATNWSYPPGNYSFTILYTLTPP